MIKLTNDTVFEEAHCLEDINNLYVYIDETDLRTCFSMFIEPENLTRITEENYGHTTYHDGYTELTSLSKSPTGCNLILRKTQ